jgi:hypothetical protein
MRPGREHRHHDLRAFDDIARFSRRFCACRHQRVHSLFRKVEDGQLMARLDQIERHGTAHISKPDKADRRHLFLPLPIVPFCAA